MIPIQKLLKTEELIKDILLTYGYGARADQERLVPHINSTPFCENRYQIIATLTERCRYFCDLSPVFGENRAILSKFYVLHNPFTAFAYRIRAPPSEV